MVDYSPITRDVVVKGILLMLENTMKPATEETPALSRAQVLEIVQAQLVPTLTPHLLESRVEGALARLGWELIGAEEPSRNKPVFMICS